MKQNYDLRFTIYDFLNFTVCKSAKATFFAERMRPKTIDQIIGQDHLLGNGKALRQIIEKGKLHSMIFWGPPGVLIIPN
jgi:putative ATPase